MIVYRAIKENELVNGIKGKNGDKTFSHANTFTYDEKINYKHFYLHYDSALMMMANQNVEDPENTYTAIAFYDIPQEVLKENIGFGVYNISNTTITNDALNLFKTGVLYFPLALPEFAIPSELIDESQCVAIEKEGKISTIENVQGFNYQLYKNKVDFIDYVHEMFQCVSQMREVSPLARLGIYDVKDIISMLSMDINKVFSEPTKN